MRAAVSALCLLAATADAKVVMRRPTVASSCSRGSTWDVTARCLTRFGQIEIIHDEKALRVVRLSAKTSDDDDGDDLSESGVFLYRSDGDGWKLAGMAEGGALDLVGVSALPHRGYRMDVASAGWTEVELADGSNARAIRATRTALYCSGSNAFCTAADTACDVLIHGKAMWSYRGTVRVIGSELVNTGDRTKAGTCAPEERLRLDWDDE